MLLAWSACRAPQPEPAAPAPTATVETSLPAARVVATLALSTTVSLEIYEAAATDVVRTWTLITHGRAAANVPELVLSVVRRPDEAADRYPEAAVELIRRLAVAGATPAWTAKAIGPALLGRDDFVGVALVPAVTPAEVPHPTGAVTILALTALELEVAQRMGVARVAPLLAGAQTLATTGWWNDRDRVTPLTPVIVADSAWSAHTVEPLPGVWVSLESAGPPTVDPRSQRILGSHSLTLDGTWRIRVTASGAATLRQRVQRISREIPQVASLELDPHASAAFVWRTVSEEVVFAGTPGRTTTVGLISFARDPSKRGGQVNSDGVVLVMSAAQQDALVKALADGRDIDGEPPSAGLMPWRLEWERP